MTVTTHMSWPDAAAYCTSVGYHLVTIEDATETNTVWELIYSGTDGIGHIEAHTWIGYNEPYGGAWQWHDGSTSTYDNFDGEVITETYGSTTYGQAAAFGDSTDQGWHEAPQTWRYASVCETP